MDEPKSIVDAIVATDYQSIVGPVSWKNGPVKNVSTTPLVGGQWVKGKDFGCLKFRSPTTRPVHDVKKRVKKFERNDPGLHTVVRKTAVRPYGSRGFASPID